MAKIERVENQLKKELNNLIAHELKDPRINSIISVTRVQTAKELKFARVFISVFGNNDSKEVLDVLNSASSFLRSKLFKTLKIREVPELHFQLDDSIEYSFKIESILKEIKPKE
ncbi:MAG: 30S ribosome-binding factor RbfA [Bacillota bacterium]|jgi:ribosome-binding factor A|nr:30S ribosome-binding factor RbfA [Bacillota bacterium]HHU42844.1 30S ribosome-binding factor RbfA [Clostridiales bacterium]